MTLQESVFKLEHYARERQYKGYDPYDALRSPFFKLPLLSSNKLIRFGTQQLVKRSPLNLRPLLLVPKGLNPVTLGLFIQGYSYLSVVDPENRQDYYQLIHQLTSRLESLVPKGYSGVCWGYDFDWEARHAKIPAYQPTVVATGIVSNGLYHAWKITGMNRLKRLVISAADFVSKDLKRTYKGNSFCFSYSPFDTQQVLNASMKGVRLLSQVYSINQDYRLKQEADLAARFVINHQREEGFWSYSLAKQGGWVDNYHTGYILDCLDEYIEHCHGANYDEHLYLGYQFYKNHFFSSDGRPAFYSDNIYPADCTAAAQSILTLSRFGDHEMAEKTALWTIRNMQAENGSFYFRKFKNYTIKTPFMRWSNAWMFAALSYLISTSTSASSIFSPLK